MLELEREVEANIATAMYFQQFGLFREAIVRLKEIKLPIKNKELENEVFKLLSYNYTKLGQKDKAIIYTDKAINSAFDFISNQNTIESKKLLAISYMNKGLLHDGQNEYDKAIVEYKKAVNYLLLVVNEDVNESGLLINSYINLGTAYFNNHDYTKSEKIFVVCLSYFDYTLKNDLRYIYIVEKLKSIERLKIIG